MKTLFTLLMLMTCFLVGAQQSKTVIYQTLPGTNIKDYSKPGYVIERNKMYPTYPGTKVRDYSSKQPSYVIETKPQASPKVNKYVIYETYPGTDVKDYGKSGIVVEEENNTNDYPILDRYDQIGVQDEY